MSWGKRKFRKGVPFKFNRVWLKDNEFNDPIKKSWSSGLHGGDSSPSQALPDNLRALKEKVKRWQNNKKKHNRLALREIQKELDLIAEKVKNGIEYSLQIRTRIMELEKKKKTTIVGY